MYINHAVLKRQLAKCVQIKLLTNMSAAARYMQQLKILEDMFVESFIVTLHINIMMMNL